MNTGRRGKFANDRGHGNRHKAASQGGKLAKNTPKNQRAARGSLRDRQQSRAPARKECLNCRNPGHLVKDCPQVVVTQKCWRCGDTTHSVRECKAPSNDSNPTPFASCFICKKEGHLSAKCPNNTKGVYPKGGSCFYCQSIHHLAKDCGMREESLNRKRDNRKQKRQRGAFDKCSVAKKQKIESSSKSTTVKSDSTNSDDLGIQFSENEEDSDAADTGTTSGGELNLSDNSFGDDSEDSGAQNQSDKVDVAQNNDVADEIISESSDAGAENSSNDSSDVEDVGVQSVQSLSGSDDSDAYPNVQANAGKDFVYSEESDSEDEDESDTGVKTEKNEGMINQVVKGASDENETAYVSSLADGAVKRFVSEASDAAVGNANKGYENWSISEGSIFRTKEGKPCKLLLHQLRAAKSEEKLEVPAGGESVSDTESSEGHETSGDCSSASQSQEAVLSESKTLSSSGSGFVEDDLANYSNEEPSKSSSGSSFQYRVDDDFEIETKGASMNIAPHTTNKCRIQESNKSKHNNKKRKRIS